MGKKSLRRTAEEGTRDTTIDLRLGFLQQSYMPIGEWKCYFAYTKKLNLSNTCNYIQRNNALVFPCSSYSTRILPSYCFLTLISMKETESLGGRKEVGLILPHFAFQETPTVITRRAAGLFSRQL